MVVSETNCVPLCPTPHTLLPVCPTVSHPTHFTPRVSHCVPPHTLYSPCVPLCPTPHTLLPVCPTVSHPTHFTPRVSHCVQVNMTSSAGLTPLHLACQYGHSESVKVLLAAGAPVDALTPQQEYALLFIYITHTATPN